MSRRHEMFVSIPIFVSATADLTADQAYPIVHLFPAFIAFLRQALTATGDPAGETGLARVSCQLRLF